MKLYLLLTLCILTNTCLAQQLLSYNRNHLHVNPLIGTAAHGHTYPGATVPFGMVQLSPDNGTQGWDWCSGYNYSDSILRGFSHTHLSGTGIGDLCDVSILPMVGQLLDTNIHLSQYSHSNEVAAPGYYQVRLIDYNINAELSATTHCGVHLYTFPQATDAAIQVDLSFALNWDRPTKCYIQQLNDTTVVGYRYSSGWAADQRVYFAIRTSKAILPIIIYNNKIKTPTTADSGTYIKAYLPIGNTSKNEKIGLKVGISMYSIAGAVAALEQVPSWNFRATVSAALAQWNKELGVIQMRGITNDVTTNFYTALYHTYLAPTIYTDAQGNYKGIKGTYQHSNTPIYTTHSLWDTYRAANPLLTITQPGRVAHIVNSYLQYYKQYGLLPVWDLHFNETNTMTGYHAVPILADAILKGIKHIDVQLAYKAMLASANQTIRGSPDYIKYGYLPMNKSGESVTITLEYAYDDWCIAQVAKLLGYTKDYNTYMKRSESYVALYKADTQFFTAKNSDGTWASSFDPLTSDYPNASPYTEGNAWQHNWYVPHNVPNHIALMGGKAKYITKLDSLYNLPTITTKNAPPDVSGLIGQYAHGNEPSHHIAYLYTLAGAPRKSAALVRTIMDSLYTTKPDGLCGNEDCGQMSAWYIFSALGFYPVNPASGQYVLGSPLVEYATIQLPAGKKLEITTINNSKQNKYIKKVTLNGKQLITPYITHTQIMSGGKLVYYMSE